MFRLPKEVASGDRNDKMTFVRDKWNRVHAEVGDEKSFEAFWLRIRLNPLLSVVEGKGEREERNIWSTTERRIVLPPSSFPEYWDELPIHHQEEGKTLIGSTFATHPPVTRARVLVDKGYPKYMSEPRNYWLVESFAKGLKMNELREISWQHPWYARRHVGVQLSPERLWRIDQGFDSGASEESSEEECAEENEAESDEEDGDGEEEKEA